MMIDLAGAVEPGSRAVQVADGNPQELYDALMTQNASGQTSRLVRGARCETLHSFFDEAAGAFQFPPFFGNNKAAYEDLMRDLSWLDPKGALVVGITDADRLMCRDDFEELMWLVEVSFRLEAAWAQRTPAQPYRVVLQSEAPADLQDMMDAWVRVSLPGLAL